MISYVNSELFNMDGVHKQINIAYDGGTITNSQIHFEQFELTESINSEGQLVFGSCEASMLKFRIVNPFNSLMGKELDVSMILNKDEANPFTFGKYYVASDKPSADRKYRDIVAYDRLYEIMNANVSDWYNALFTEEKPEMTLREFRDSFFEYFGIEQEEVALANDAMVVSKTIDGNQITGKIVLNAICEINGCFGRIGRNGKFKYIVLNNQSGNAGRKTLASNEYIGSPTYEDYLVRPMTGLQIRTQENDIGVNIGTEENKYVIQDNFLVYGKGTEELTEIVYNVFNQIYYVTYIPFTTQTLGDPTAEPGDLITINTKTVTLDSYILNRTIKGIQALRDTFSATGNEYYQENTNSVMAEIIKLKGKSNVLERSIEETKSTIEDVEKGFKTEITQTAEGLRIEVAGKYATQEDVASSLENLQQQIDGAIETYTASNIPTLENYPANEWSDEEKETHIGDLYIVNSNGGDYAGFYYRFEKDGDEYYWTLLRDNEITKALQDAEEANKKAQEALNASITGVDVQYALSDSPSVAPTSGWSTTAPEWVDGKYMWQKTVTTYGSGATSESTPTNITGATGNNGQDGQDGKDGTSITITSKEVVYQSGTSGTAAPTGTWTTSIPAVAQGNYLWTRTTVKYSDDTTTVSYSVSRQGINGNDGKDGKDGSNGADGTSVYIKSDSVTYQVSSSGTTTPTGNWSTSVPATSAGQYLWTKIEVEYSDGTVTTSYSVSRNGSNGTNGTNGTNGDDGVGISSISNKYAVSSSNSTAPTTWYDTVQTMTSTNKYLWNYEIITLTNGDKQETAKRVIGVYGDTGETGPQGPQGETGEQGPQGEQGEQGDKGDKGDTGKGISSITEYYLASTAASGITTSTSGWTTSIQTVTATKKYLWNYEVIAYTSGSPYTSAPVIIGVYGDTGAKGDKGDTGETGATGATGPQGATGKGVSSIVEQYYLSTSNTTQTGGSWSTTSPAWKAGYYIWTRSYITWSDNTTSTTTPVLANALNSAYESIEDVKADVEVNADNIKLKVSKGEVSSQLSLETGKITLSGNRIVIDSTNFHVSEDGTITAINGSFNGYFECANDDETQSVKMEDGIIKLQTGSEAYAEISGSMLKFKSSASSTYNYLEILGQEGIVVNEGDVNIQGTYVKQTLDSLNTKITANANSISNLADDLGYYADGLSWSGWRTAYTNGYCSIRYAKCGGMVTVYGTGGGSVNVTGMTAITPCTLPSGYRPAFNVISVGSPQDASGYEIQCGVDTSGNVSIYGLGRTSSWWSFIMSYPVGF